MGGLYLTSGSKTDEGVTKDNVLPGLGIEPGTPGPKCFRIGYYLTLENTYMPFRTLWTYLDLCYQPGLQLPWWCLGVSTSITYPPST